ncbi:MAG: hypothetical protein KGJ21_09915 [Pseudomonadota bacterium]|nr:hypothetical protein [Pseudomonadota bacterium]
MYLAIATDQRVDLRTVTAERTGTGSIWLRPDGGAYSLWMDNAAARELVRQLQALLDEPMPEVTP